MKVTTFAKAGASTTAVAALSLGLFAPSAFAASLSDTQEDPTGIPAASTLVGVGSDTTQDVMYGIAQAIGNQAGTTTPVIASYTATGGSTITYRSGLPVARPNGSGAGYKALGDSIGLTAAGVAKPGDVDFARASGTQGVLQAGTNGASTDIPFATDTVSLAVPADSPFLLTNSGDGLTWDEIAGIYGGTYKYVNSTTGALLGAAAAGAVPIQAFVPKAGSGSRQFFLGQIAAAAGLDLASGGSTKGDGLFTAAGTPTTAPYVGAKDYIGGDVQEHNAAVLTAPGAAPANVAAIAPFSGAKFIGYHNGKVTDPDTGKSAAVDYKLVPFNPGTHAAPAADGVLPYSGSSAFVPNAAYVTGAVQPGGTGKLTRQVFNIIATSVVKNPGATPKSQLIAATFVGATSKVCLATTAIQDYGFIPLASGCGDTSKTYDVPSTATPTVTASAAKAGGTATLTVSVQSNGNGGGTATITVGGTNYTVAIPAGSTSGSVTVPTPSAGVVAVTGGFIPALAGVAPAQINGSFSVAAATAPATLNSVAIAGKAKVGKTVKAVVAPATLVGVSYQWFSNGKKVKGATKASFKVTKKLKKKKLTVKATYAGVTKTSAAVKVK